MIDDKMCKLPNLKAANLKAVNLNAVVSATSVANHGVSSNHYHCSYHIGPALEFYDIVQEMGQTDHD